MTLWILAAALTLTFGSAAVVNAAPAPPGPLGLVKASVARVLEVVQTSVPGSSERRTGITRVSQELFDFNEMTRRALGQHWKGLSAAEQQEFVRLFTDILERAFVASADGYTDGMVAFRGETLDGAWAQVRSQITPAKGAAVSIEYRLHETDLRWTVYDVVSEHVSLVANYRSQFNTVIRSSSAAQLLERLRTDRLEREQGAQKPRFIPGPLTAGLFLAVLTRRAPSR